MVKTKREVILEKYNIVVKDLAHLTKDTDVLFTIKDDNDISVLVTGVLYYFSGYDDFQTLQGLLKSKNIILTNEEFGEVYNIIIPFVDFLRDLNL